MCDCLDEIFSSFECEENNLIPVLQKIQEKFGYLSEENMQKTALYLRVPPSRVYGVATFYAQFRFQPIGRSHVLVCQGTACHVNGSARVLQDLEKKLGIENGQTREDREYTLQTVACIGACGLAPCIMVNNRVEANMDAQRIETLFSLGGTGNDG